MVGTLYVVGTPIGNLEDWSVRAVRTLQQVDFIAAEDTRVTLKLLNHFEIKKPMVSYHEHNQASAGQAILNRLLGRTVPLSPMRACPASPTQGRTWCASAPKQAFQCR